MTLPNELPDHVREFVAGLDSEDIATLKLAIRLFKDMQGWCRITRWLVFTALGGMLLFSNALEHFRAWLFWIVGLKGVR